MEMDQASDTEEDPSDDDDEQQCDEKFILIWMRAAKTYSAVHFYAFRDHRSFSA